jgi:Lar family restriction alleviation protein
MSETNTHVLTLKKCPFCGGEAKIKRREGGDERNGYPVDIQVECQECPAVGRTYVYYPFQTDGLSIEDATAKAVAYWNKRA